MATGADDIASSGEKPVSTHGVESTHAEGDRLSSEARLPAHLRNGELDRERTIDPLKSR